MNRVQMIRYGLWAAAALLLVAAAALTWNRFAPTATPAPALATPAPISRPTGEAGVTIGGPFQLVSDEGETVTQAALLGHPSILFFGFTHCPDICPTALADVGSWLTALGPEAAALAAYFITVDPERDTQTQINAYLSSFNPAIIGLTGDPAAVRAMLDAYRVIYRRVDLEGGEYTMNHTASFYLLDRQGELVGAIDNLATQDEALAKLRALLANA